MKHFSAMFNILRSDRSMFKFLWGVVLGLSFSMAVILSAMGLMEGFEKTFLLGLRKASGDLSIGHTNGFFLNNVELDQFLSEARKIDALQKFPNVNFQKMIQSESFLVASEESKAVLIKGLEHLSTNLIDSKVHNQEILKGEILIGSSLAEFLHIKKGDDVNLAFPKGNAVADQLPSFYRFKVKDIIHHGIYQKDMRLVYMQMDELKSILNIENKINMIILELNVPDIQNTRVLDDIKNIEKALNHLLPRGFYARAFWRDFSSLIEAVRVEKKMMAIILQIVVVVAIFNLLAFIIYLTEKKRRDFFLLRALGLSQKSNKHFWYLLMTGIWMLSAICSLVLVYVFSLSLKHLDLLKMPEQIYFMPRLSLSLKLIDYSMVFSTSLFLIFLMSFILLKKMENQSPIESLKKDFH